MRNDFLAENASRSSLSSPMWFPRVVSVSHFCRALGESRKRNGARLTVLFPLEEWTAPAGTKRRWFGNWYVLHLGPGN